jgi:diphthamide biosynthesis enzyme Dph1/Dph2-like protein
VGNGGFLLINGLHRKATDWHGYFFLTLVPIDETPGISILYIFVDIQVNLQHLVDTLKHHFKSDSKLALVSTIQFVRTLQVRCSI